ncbi:Pc21g00220 [Talaromyces islandicus]|uniref:Pc21g00220 n=1 Tax=Talaromyces islandicus TaxID=28573 RepID=A0A0U1MBA6_TALIS|nr:Pc21g00220 [Talaromyces islandicus]
MKPADQSQVDQWDRSLSICSRTRFLATARVRLDCLVVADHVEQRMDDGRALSRWNNIIKAQGCLRLAKDYYVKVLVDAVDWNHRLALRSDGDQLPELVVPIDYQLIAQNHRHLLQAAQATLQGTARWWVVEIYLQDDTGRDDALVRTFRECQLNEGLESDGVIYRRIRFYQGRLGGGKDENAERDAWAALLHKPRSRKKYYLERFLRNERLPPAVDHLMAAPGLAAGMKIGRLNELISLRCDERALCALEHIRHTWVNRVLGDEPLLSLVDQRSVQALESLVPAVSESDRTSVCHHMDNMTLFPALTDPEVRQRVRDRLQTIEYPIPTLHTFFQDLRYLRVAKNAMALLYPRQKRGDRATVDEKMAACFERDTADPTTMRGGLWELWRFSLQYGFEMATSHSRRQRPLPDQGSQRNAGPVQSSTAGPVPSAGTLRCHFANLAERMGFRSTHLTALRTREKPSATVLPVPSRPDTASDDEPIKRRCGLPYEYSAASDRWALSAEVLHQPLLTSTVGTAFLRRSFVHAFFWDLRPSIDSPCHHVETPPANVANHDTDDSPREPIAAAIPATTPAAIPINGASGSPRSRMTREDHVDDDVGGSSHDRAPVSLFRVGVQSILQADDQKTSSHGFPLEVYDQDGHHPRQIIQLPADRHGLERKLGDLQQQGLVFSIAPSRGIDLSQCYDAMTSGIPVRAGPSSQVGGPYEELPRSPAPSANKRKDAPSSGLPSLKRHGTSRPGSSSFVPSVVNFISRLRVETD